MCSWSAETCIQAFHKAISLQPTKTNRHIKCKEGRICYKCNSRSPQPFPFQLTPSSQLSTLTSSATQPPLPDIDAHQKKNCARTQTTLPPTHRVSIALRTHKSFPGVHYKLWSMSEFPGTSQSSSTESCLNCKSLHWHSPLSPNVPPERPENFTTFK